MIRVFFIFVVLPFCICLSVRPVCGRDRPEIRRSFELAGQVDETKIYRVSVSVRNLDTLFLSSIFIPYDQSSWRFSVPPEKTWQASFLDIGGSARAGTGLWRERISQERWYPVSDRVWIADCELGGVEMGGTVILAFYASVDASINMEGKPLRIAYGTCGEEMLASAPEYWSSTAGLLLERVSNLDTIQVYRYSGRADTLTIYNAVLWGEPDAPEGWDLVGYDGSRAVFARKEGLGQAAFEIGWRDSVGTTGLVNWAEGSPGVDYGFAPGPGFAQYSLLDTIVVARESEWGALFHGLAVVCVFLTGVLVSLRLRRRKGR
jgi:hypothetical protein